MNGDATVRPDDDSHPLHVVPGLSEAIELLEEHRVFVTPAEVEIDAVDRTAFDIEDLRSDIPTVGCGGADDILLLALEVGVDLPPELLDEHDEL